MRGDLIDWMLLGFCVVAILSGCKFSAIAFIIVLLIRPPT